jgi:hypothetical protein
MFSFEKRHSLLLARSDDSAGVTTSPTGGLECTEGGGTDVFSLVLTSEPTSDVTVGVSSSDTTEGSLGGVAAVSFTSGSWATVQVVTVTGVNDDVVDGDVAFSVVVAAATSDDSNYHLSVDGSDVIVTTTGGKAMWFEWQQIVLGQAGGGVVLCLFRHSCQCLNGCVYASGLCAFMITASVHLCVNR